MFVNSVSIYSFSDLTCLYQGNIKMDQIFRHPIYNCKWHLVAYYNIYPAMIAFTDQYILPNIFFDIGQL
jgi:hypothetical protein